MIHNRHLLSIRDLTIEEIEAILSVADGYVGGANNQPLLGRTIIQLFFENSTRTLLSFEMAGRGLGAQVINLPVAHSSINKGETLQDTASTINAMSPDCVIIRHASSGAAQLFATQMDCSVINAGDGSHEHPTQALIDALALKRKFVQIKGLTVAICGDILHSRVARSNIILLNKLGANVRLVGPKTLLPASARGMPTYHNMKDGLAGTDAVMMLRLQNERMHGSFIPSLGEFVKYYRLDYNNLNYAKPGAWVLHPGPVNKEVEIIGALADDATRSMILEQVTLGVAMRKAVLALLIR